MRYADQSKEDQALTDRVLARHRQAEPFHSAWRRQAERRYAMYRSYLGFRDLHKRTSPPDRDVVLREGQREWGAKLFIPYCYAVVETIVPRMLSHRPKMLVLPRTKVSERNIEPVRQIIEAQQEQISYELILQTAAKVGLIYGLGVTKDYWKIERDQRLELQPPSVARKDGPTVIPVETKKEIHNDPFCEAVDPFDFFWDPTAYNMDNARFVIHRIWRDTEYVTQMVKSKKWRNVTLTDADELPGPTDARDSVWQERMNAAGYSDLERRENPMHEIWEYWEKGRVIKVLNKQVVVEDGPNPYWHKQLPFSIYRPTEVPHEFAGIGEIEPIEHLQVELNALRSQRRDNANVALNAPMAVWDGLVDPEDIAFGPGVVIPVPGDPRELLHQLQVKDIPASGYQEELSMKADLELASGISEAVTGGEGSQGGTSSTATGAQLVQAAANVRIRNKTRRVERELIARDAALWLEMNQQKIRDAREVRVSPHPTEGMGADRRWTWAEVGPEELRGEFHIIPEGGSTEPENVPQKQASAMQLYSILNQNPFIDQPEALAYVLGQFDIPEPERWVRQPEPPLDPNVIGKLLEAAGMEPEQILALLQAAQEASAQLAAGGGQDPQGQEESQNGAAPQEQVPA